ncbi:Uncharacterized membrane protein YczE [Selenomonas sp. GACV-9]|uniref:YczE/YyaS/YitT family protein n=1 Tax=Selenomonas sp. GACV-9 TaxID=3158782 RepID=UPI0008E62D8F|nr:Uncharacterized membrane protein YczE [Selenomonas ruminantium]
MGMTESVRWEGQKESFMSRRIAAIIGAHVAMGFSVVLMRFSLCGNDPFSCMNLGYASVSGLSYGACVIIFNLLLILPVLWLDRSYIRVGTLVNMFLLGIIADFWYALLAPLAVFSEPSLLLRGLLLMSGVLLTCLACSFYMSSRLGMGPYDAIGWILAARTNGRMSFRTVRVLIDICAVTIGFACGSIVGLGTLVLACGTGPLIEFFNKKISQPLLYGRKI